MEAEFKDGIGLVDKCHKPMAVSYMREVLRQLEKRLVACKSVFWRCKL